MANLLKLYLDTTQNRLVVGSTNPQIARLPTFYQGDVIPVQLVLLEEASGGLNPTYTPLSEVGITVKLGLVSPHPKTNAEHAVATLAWDAGLQAWTGMLDLNTAEIARLLGESSTAQCFFEIELSAETFVSTEYQGPVTVTADGIKSS